MAFLEIVAWNSHFRGVVDIPPFHKSCAQSYATPFQRVVHTLCDHISEGVMYIPAQPPATNVNGNYPSMKGGYTQSPMQ